jgi:hypothetical protein
VYSIRSRKCDGSYADKFNQVAVAMDFDDDTIAPREENRADDTLAQVLRWAGLIFALGLLASAVVIASWGTGYAPGA